MIPRIFTLFVSGLVLLVALIVVADGWYIVDPTDRGVETTMGRMSADVLSPGFGFKLPILSSVAMVNVQQSTRELEADCFSSDLQAVTIKVKVLFRVPEGSAVQIKRDYAGNPFDALITPRVQEALKEVTAVRTAADIVQSREKVKQEALMASQQKIGAILTINDIVIEDVGLSKDLEDAIEQKMVQQQAAEKAKFTLEQAETDAQTKVVAATADAQSIKIQGDALKDNPELVRLKWVEKWDGRVPTYVGGGSPLMTLPATDVEPAK